MEWKEARKKAFRIFPIADVLAAVLIAAISAVSSLYDQAMSFGLPAFVCLLGALLFFAGLRQGERPWFLSGARAIIIGVLALPLVFIFQQIMIF